MNAPLWDKVWDFKLDKPEEEYGFSTRLAYENAWTLNFTQSAILEYKKFMFLAATGSEMVSPSEIVDVVWHQHLIFTESYREFCELLGKKIAHIPSTRNHSEKEKFAKAKERTKVLYESYFGKQVDEIWNYHSPLDSLKLKKLPLSLNIADVHQYLILCFSLFIAMSYFLFKPLFIKLEGLDFLLPYIAILVIVFMLLEAFTEGKFYAIIRKVSSNQIIQNLNPFELIYMKTNKLEKVVHGLVNAMVEENKIKVLKNEKIVLADSSLSDSPFENCIIETLKVKDDIYYVELVKKVIEKRIFRQIPQSVHSISEKVSSSSEFLVQYFFSILIVSFLFSIGTSRLILGLLRDKPVDYLVIALIACFIATVAFADRYKEYFSKNAIPALFQEKIKQDKNQYGSWAWAYFLVGYNIFTPSFSPLASYVDKNDSSSSCGSSDGGSGSSCGGGGCGGGCGGCGG